MAKIYSSDMTPTQVKNASRDEIIEKITEFLKDLKGEDAVTKISNTEIAVATGESSANGGEVCSVIKVTGKEFMDRTAKTKSYTAFDRYAAGAAYEQKLIEAAEKKKS